jgi:hypothetical protein
MCQRGEQLGTLAKGGSLIQGIAKGAMATDSAFWLDLAAQFRLLPGPTGDLVAIRSEEHWGFDWLGEEWQGARVRELFGSLARRAAIAAGVPDRSNALDAWLDLLREESPHFQSIKTASDPEGGGWIRNPALASAEYCDVRATRVFELETVAAGGGASGLRRDRYPFCYWLYDHLHEPITDPKAEFDYWTKHVWRGYHVLIENYESMGMAWPDRQERLNSATAGLSYDLAVLQANYVLDRGLRGNEAIQAFRGAAAELQKEVVEVWRASCEQLKVESVDEPEGAKCVTPAFRRVQDDLGRLLDGLQPSVPQPATPERKATRGRPKAIAIAGEKIRKLRGKTIQKTFCWQCKISTDVLQKAERGSATQETIEKICKYAAKEGKKLTPEELKTN